MGLFKMLWRHVFLGTCSYLLPHWRGSLLTVGQPRCVGAQIGLTCYSPVDLWLLVKLLSEPQFTFTKGRIRSMLFPSSGRWIDGDIMREFPKMRSLENLPRNKMNQIPRPHSELSETVLQVCMKVFLSSSDCYIHNV